MPYYKIRETTTVAASGGISAFNPIEIPVTNATTNLIGANAGRKSLAIINESEFEMFINSGDKAESPASGNSKIKIIPAQTEYIWLPNEMPLGVLNATWVGAGASGPGKVVIVEGV
ncbi:hypothetical protein NG791_28655 [Laspinema sp. D1]|uniref:hypothetical protein n=1 Tax=Laspinema palackyanum TaxID=3231601 RepID=UPI0034811A9F|nr:hypothetical protein [Laspinema sp. D2b]